MAVYDSAAVREMAGQVCHIQALKPPPDNLFGQLGAGYEPDAMQPKQNIARIVGGPSIGF